MQARPEQTDQGIDYASIKTVVAKCNNSIAEVHDKSLGFDLAIYKSPERDVGLILCGWKFATIERTNYDDIITRYANLIRLQYEGKFGKAAALIFFVTGDLKKSVEFLNGSRGPYL